MFPSHDRLVGYGIKGATEKKKVQRLLSISKAVIDKIEDHNVKYIGIENYAFAARGAQNSLGELHGAVKSQIWLSSKIECVMISPMTARKVVFGKGNIKKKEVFNLVKDMGIPVTTNNQSDAYCICKALIKMTNKSGENNG